MALTKEQTDRFAEVNGIQIHYNEAGSGPALICTHGGGPGANAWDNTRYSFDALAEHFRVILMDMPGFGESQKLVSREGVPMDYFCAKLQLGLMDQLGIDRAHLYGSSAFSATAIRFGIEYPDRVGKIVVQAWSPVHGPETAGLKSLGPGHLESRKEFSGRASSDVRPDLHKLKTDVLITWGEADGVIPVEGVLDALRLIPNSRAYVWGDNSGHFVCYEHPEEFARVVTAFLTS
jgi:pimeloyl-ACP methyl ester carboxylesterase